MKIALLAIHPLKGGMRVKLDRSEVDGLGLKGDRTLMLVDGDGEFVTQRSLPALARLSVRLVPGGAVLSMSGEREARFDGGRMDVGVWGDRVSAAAADEETAGWLSQRFGRPLRLVRFDATSSRRVDPDFSDDGQVGFADGYPILVTTTGSLRSLNAEIEHSGSQPVPMERFRPNIVIDCDEPWDEDRWRLLRVGDVLLDFVKPCSRCTVTTVDQQLGTVTGDEPLSTLKRIRMSADRRVPGVLFGWNAVPRNAGSVRVGDPVSVVRSGEAWPVRPADR